MLQLHIPTLAVFLACLASLAGAPPYPPLPEPADPAAYGRGIQRTMQLLADSTPENRNRVKILFYGQSIVGQRWSDAVVADLRRRFPHADIDARNLAIGGFSSPRLVRTMHYDVFPFYPDLIVFHVFGGQDDYERIIRAFRSRTTAEVIIQTDHLKEWPDPKAPALAEQRLWNDKMSWWFLPRYAEKYGCALQPQRREWEQYLRAHDLQPKDLLRDNVHLNAHGKWLMAELLKRFLVVRPEDTPPAHVRTLVVGKDIHWSADGRLVVPFQGNRVEALAGRGEIYPMDVRIDGRSPADFPECHTFTRPTMTGGIHWPAFMMASRVAPPVVEQWTVRFYAFNDDHSDFFFTVEGSVTGYDGAGRGAERFVSDSGRLVIEPEDWIFNYSFKVASRRGNPVTRPGWTVRWEVRPLFTETYTPPRVEYPEFEYPTVLASNLPASRHVLELVSPNGPVPALEAIRVYSPPMEAADISPTGGAADLEQWEGEPD